jgi:hypothetical protein
VTGGYRRDGGVRGTNKSEAGKVFWDAAFLLGDVDRRGDLGGEVLGPEVA